MGEKRFADLRAASKKKHEQKKKEAEPKDPTDFSLFRIGKRFADAVNGKKSKRRD